MCTREDEETLPEAGTGMLLTDAPGELKEGGERGRVGGAELTPRGVATPLSLMGGCHGERAGPEQRGIQWEMTLLVSPW